MECIHGSEECVLCDALTSTHPDTRCAGYTMLDGALLTRCMRNWGHTGKCRAGNIEFNGKNRIPGRYELVDNG